MIRRLAGALPLVAALACCLLAAGPAAADPLSGAIIAIGGLMSSAAGAVSAGSILTNLVASVATSALARALAGRPQEAGAAGIQSKSTVAGGTLAQTIILGRACTGGALLCPPYSHGIAGDSDELEQLTVPIAVADVPIDGLEAVIIDGRSCVFGVPSDRDGGIYGNTCSEYEDRAFLRWHDGRQTVPDAMLRQVYGEHPTRPWAATAVLTGVSYAVLSYKYDPEVWTSLPSAKFVVRGMRLYDPRRDTSVGGSGGQRWGDPSTWVWTENPIVMAYNLFRGITLPDGTVYGVRVAADRLPLANWAAAMNVCDQAVAVSGGGTRPRYVAGLEFAVTDEPLDVIERVGLACGADFADLGGEWVVSVGAPPVISASLTDDDIILGEAEDFDPIAPLTDTYNGAHASYPNPARLWEPAEASPWYDAGLEAEDGGRRLTADLALEAVPVPRQVRALMREYVRDHRRMRSHVITLPPVFLGVRPLQTIAWTSSHNGYSAKLFEVRGRRIDPMTLCVTLTLRERDPADYDPDMIGDAVLPVDPSIVVDDRPRNGVFGFTVAALTVGRRPALRGTWSAEIAAQTVIVQARRTGWTELVHEGRIPAAAGGVTIIAGIMPGTAYQLRARAIGRRPGVWGAWQAVTTPDARIGRDDLADTITATIDEAAADAAAALTAAADASGRADQALALANQAADVDAVIGRALAGGWTRNPTFAGWSTGSPPGPLSWSRTGVASITRSTTGWLHGSAARLDAPGSTDVSLAASMGAGQLTDDADTHAVHVVLGLMVEFVSGALSAGRASVQWRTASGAFTDGSFPGIAGDVEGGRFDLIGLRPTPGVRQALQVIVRRPDSVGPDATDLRVVLYGGRASRAASLSVIVHALDVRAATAAEVDQLGLRAYTDAAITVQDTTFRGLLGAGAWETRSVNARFGQVEGAVVDLAVATADADSALAARLVTVEAMPADGNLCINGAFQDGARPAGERPNLWETWPAAWRVETRGGSASTRLATCPTQFCAWLPADGATQFGRFVGGMVSSRIAVRPGDRFLAQFSYATAGGAADVALRIAVTWYDSAGAVISTPVAGVSGIGSVDWTDFAQQMTAPAGAAAASVSLNRAGGGSGSAMVTSVYFGRIDPALARRLDAVIAFKAKAGTGGAELVLASTSDDGLATSTAKIHADNILLDGSVAVRKLVIGDFGNLVPDNQIQDQSAWVVGSGGWTFSSTAGAGAGSIGAWRSIDGTGDAYVSSALFPVERFSGDDAAIYAARVQVRRMTGSTMRAILQVVWCDAAGAALSVSNAASYDGTSGATQRLEGRVTADAAAVYARLRLRVDAVATTGDVRFSGPWMRKQAGAVEIKDGAVSADHIAAGAVTASKIAVTSLSAVSANLGSILVDSAHIDNLAVDTIHVKNGAITESSGARTTGVITCDTSWTEVQTITVVSPANAARQITLSWQADAQSGQTGAYQVKLQKRTGSGSFGDFEVYDQGFPYSPAYDAVSPWTLALFDTDTTGTTYYYRIMVRAVTASSPPAGWVNEARIKKRSLIVGLFKK